MARLDDEEFRNAAAAGLAALGDRDAILPLAAALERVRERFDYGSYLGRYWLGDALATLGDRTPATKQALEEVIDRDFGFDMQQTWGSFRDTAVDRLVEMEGAAADDFLLAFLKRERETLQLRYHIARRFWLAGDRQSSVVTTIGKMARHPSYPTFAAEARALLAPDGSGEA